MFLAREKGTHRDHLVTYNSCDCEFFLFSTILGSGKPCIHMEAYRLASEKEDFLRISARSDDFKQILTEVFAYGKSLKLRKLISSRYD
ncbi:metal-binding protein [Metallosphaera hakonensis JCM 8857 = DSM 7519]|uniref:Metal-binding protein n=1 Tax=Metallosphaera hakonensis JCM 8857 = DSM 7519 TaxID=1293036 RepID=A0A2U9IWX6_9CREN|nr:metal-binding protein [Metallosphaera hakonensis JCM 8857 = DSM 7519]